ncbi:hypothetical protein SAMN05421770_106293 [Granulicella rosea]|uniref:DUF885 domain-containing protein n=1 Tax=Granulicella rosea TaxID=474952 RepID=A0A239LBX3_9BACT|nr:hypothetical protein [Granulicella rosea]SNT28126.1 hypothetical protein SAMN05421770_106293 [Granulicella rosea]
MMQSQARPDTVIRSLRAGASLCLLLLAGGCRTREPAPAPALSHAPWEAASRPDNVDSIARDYVRVALALGERDPDSLDFSVAPATVADEVKRAYASFDEIDGEAAALESRLQHLAFMKEDQPRREFLRGQLAAVRARVRMVRAGVYLDFDSEAAALFATTRLPDTDAEAARRRAMRTEILRQLPTTAAGKSEAIRYGAYDARFLIPPEKLRAVMTAALDACRQRTLEHITLPAGESVDLTFVHRQPWSAFSRYRGDAHSTISLNLDYPITVDDALELACHEGYPGHHVFNTLRDRTLRLGRGWPELEAQLTFSPQSYLSEAEAAYAPRLAFSTAERAQVERDILFPLAGMKPAEAARYVAISAAIRELSSAEPAIAREYLDGRLEYVRADNRLSDEVLMAQPDASLLYMNEYRSYMLAYTDGPRRIAAALPAASSTPEEQKARWKAYEELMTTLRTKLP